MNIYSATVTLLLVLDPLGNIPLCISLLKHVSAQRRTQIILRENLIAFGILAAFLFCGTAILHGLDISEEALRIAGGVVLFLIAIKMLFPSRHNPAVDHNPEEPLIVPLAIPMIAGPSAMALVILFANQAPKQMSHWFTALTIASVISTLILLCAVPLQRLLGSKLTLALEQLMGMILTTIAVQMFLTGVGAYLKGMGVS